MFRKDDRFSGWAAGWATVADRYMAKAKAAANPKEADVYYLRAWRLYYFGQWPAPTSPGKQANYVKAVEAYLAHAKAFDPPLEIVRIPFEGTSLPAYFIPATGRANQHRREDHEGGERGVDDRQDVPGVGEPLAQRETRALIAALRAEI